MRGFKATLRRSWPVLIAYALFSMWGVGCLLASLFLSDAKISSAEGLAALGGILAATAVGHVLGNLLGLAGFRLGPIVLLFFGAFIGVGAIGIGLGPIALFLLCGLFAALGGYLGIASRLDVVACWYPLAFAIGGAVTWMNHHGALATFRSGSKHALWDGFSIACLTGAVFFMLVFLATRNALGLTVWQEVGRPLGGADGDSDSQVVVARPGRGSFGVLFVFTLVVIGATALVSPYLFRTRDADGQDGSGQSDGQGQAKQGDGHDQSDQSGQGNGQGKGKRRRGQGGSGSGDGEADEGPDGEGASQAAREAADLALKIFLWLLIAAIILLLLFLVLLPPIRRAFLLRHLEKPLWPVAPTSRVMNLWRRALAALRVLEIEPEPGEPPIGFARRARGELAQVGFAAPGLEDAAAIVEKVDYAGRGLGSEDEQTMRAAVEAFLAAVTPRTPLRKRFFAGWAAAPEVES